MLSEDALNKLIQPIIDRQEAISNFVIEVIAQRVKEIGHLLPSDVYRLERLLKTGNDVRKINAEIARLTGLNEREIKKLIKDIAEDAYADAKPYYDYRNKSYVPFERNEELQRVVTAVAKQTADTYINLSKAQAFMIRDLKNPKRLIPTSIARTYQSVIDEAVQASQSGTIDYNTAMRRTLHQLADSGIRYVVYEPESGKKYTQRLDTAVRRNLLDGIRAINQGVQDEVGKQFGADGKEITVHMNSAPDHEPIQGHQFTDEEFEKLQTEQAFEDLNGNKFAPIERAIGTLNCRHFTYSIICGVTKPNYTQTELDKMIEKNQKGYVSLDGRHLTLYECTQYQRELETKIRRAKENQMAFKAAGNITEAQKYQIMINKYTRQYKMFSKACGLNAQTARATVSGYRKISV